MKQSFNVQCSLFKIIRYVYIARSVQRLSSKPDHRGIITHRSLIKVQNRNYPALFLLLKILVKMFIDAKTSDLD